MATCPGCGGEATTRVNGRIREHRISRGWLCAGSGRLPVLERDPEPPVTDAPAPRISEELLFQGYSGLVARRRFPIPTVETVRSRLAAADEADDADGVDSRDELVAPADDPTPATTR